jgi:hypothetical protein
MYLRTSLLINSEISETLLPPAPGHGDDDGNHARTTAVGALMGECVRKRDDTPLELELNVDQHNTARPVGL